MVAFGDNSRRVVRPRGITFVQRETVTDWRGSLEPKTVLIGLFAYIVSCRCVRGLLTPRNNFSDLTLLETFTFFSLYTSGHGIIFHPLKYHQRRFLPPNRFSYFVLNLLKCKESQVKDDEALQRHTRQELLLLFATTHHTKHTRSLVTAVEAQTLSRQAAT